MQKNSGFILLDLVISEMLENSCLALIIKYCIRYIRILAYGAKFIHAKFTFKVHTNFIYGKLALTSFCEKSCGTSVAQMTEHSTGNRKDLGSIPSGVEAFLFPQKISSNFIDVFRLTNVLCSVASIPNCYYSAKKSR